MTYWQVEIFNPNTNNLTGLTINEHGCLVCVGDGLKFTSVKAAEDYMKEHSLDEHYKVTEHMDIDATGSEVTPGGEFEFISEEDLPKTGKYILKFWAVWCGPCKTLAPVMTEIVREKGITVINVDVDKHPGYAQFHHIRGIPTMMFIKDGQAKHTLIGNQPKAEIISTYEAL